MSRWYPQQMLFKSYLNLTHNNNDKKKLLFSKNIIFFIVIAIIYVITILFLHILDIIIKKFYF